MATKFLDYTGLSYLWSKFKEWCNSIFVTKATDENITGTKTFVGSKKIAFKQSGATDKLGFTLFNNSGKEQGYLEYNPTNKIAGIPLMMLGNYATADNELTYVGFRRYSNISGASGAYNLLTPLISDAKNHFNLTTTYTNFYLPLGISDGTNIVTADNGGVIDISSLMPTIPTIPSLSRTISGSGNAITDITVSGHAITATKGSTFLTSASTLDATKLSGTIPSSSIDDSNYVHQSGNENISGDKVFKGHVRFSQGAESAKFDAAFYRDEDEIGVNGLRRILFAVTEYRHGGQYSGDVYGPNISLASPFNGSNWGGAGNITLEARTTDKDTGVITSASLKLVPEGSLTWQGVEIANINGVDHINAVNAGDNTELDMQKPNTVYNVEGLANTTCSSNAPQPTVYQAATSVFFGLCNNSSNDWSRGFWLYGKWNDKPDLWYGARKRDDPNNLKKISWYKIAFRDENNINDNISIFISKNGSDANDGLTSSTPVLTWERAQLVARRMQIQGVILFCFGPGEWGTIYVNGNTFQSSGVKIANYTNTSKNTIDEFEALTDSSYRGNQPPHFTRITVDNARLLFGNISVDIFAITDCINVENHTCKFSTLEVNRSAITLNEFLVEKTATDSNVIVLHEGNLTITGTPPKIKFINSPTYQVFIHSSGMSRVYINPALTCTGTLNALRYVFGGYTMLVDGSLNVTEWPGTTNGSGAGMFSRRSYLDVGGANVTLHHPNVTKGTKPNTIESFNINFKGKNELDESNTLGSLGLINCVMEPNGNVNASLTVFKNIAGSNDAAQIVIQNPLNGEPKVSMPCLRINGTSTATEGGEIWLNASPNGPSYNGIVLDQCAGVFRIFGSASADGTSRVGAGTALQIDPYAKKIFCSSGGYEFTNGVTNTPDSSDNSTRIANTTWVRTYHSSSSDKRVKQDFANVSDDLLNAWDNISWQQYKLINEVKESGDTAPIRFGIVVQDVQELLKSSSIDPDQYGFMYHLKYQGTDGDEPTEDNPEITKADKWYLNYNEALSIEAAYQRRKNKILENRITELETQVQNMLQVLESLKGA